MMLPRQQTRAVQSIFCDSHDTMARRKLSRHSITSTVNFRKCLNVHRSYVIASSVTSSPAIVLPFVIVPILAVTKAWRQRRSYRLSLLAFHSSKLSFQSKEMVNCRFITHTISSCTYLIINASSLCICASDTTSSIRTYVDSLDIRSLHQDSNE